MLNVTKSDEIIKVDTICTTIYSQPGLGKTSLAFTSSRPLLLDFDKGAHRAHDRKDVVQVSQWSDVAGIKADDLKGYDTIVLDTVGKALDCLAADIVKSGAKFAYGGALNQQGWGQLGVRFGAYLRLLRSFGKDVILISHMDEQKDGDGIKERLKISGGTKDLVLTDSDVIGRIFIHNRQRSIVFSPTETAFGKDPAQVGTVEIPDVSDPMFSTFMTDMTNRIKDGLNSLSEEQIARKSEVEWFDAALPEVMDADGINAILGRAKKAGRDIAMKVVARAGELGLEYDNESQGYVYLKEATPEGEADPQPENEAA